MSLRSAEGLSPPLADEIYPTRAQAPEHHITSVSVVFNPTKLHGNPMGKKYELAKLVALRRSETHPRYLSLSHYEDGFYDLDFVVPWTAGAKNVDAALMIIGQDWISEDYLKRNSLPEKRLARREAGQDAGLATNRNLKKLLANAFGLLFSDTYATNVSVFIKPGNMDANVPMRDLEHFAKKFTLPQIRIVKPRMVLCLGERTFNAVRRAAGYTDLKLSEAYTPLPHTILDGAEVYGIPHTGSWGTMNAGGEQRVATGPHWRNDLEHCALRERRRGFVRRLETQHVLDKG